MDRGPHGSRTVTLGALTFDYHLLHRFDWQKTQTAGVPAPGFEKYEPLQKSPQLECYYAEHKVAMIRFQE